MLPSRSVFLPAFVAFVNFALLPFSAPGADVAPVQVSVLAKTGTSWDGGSLPAYPRGEPEITLLKIIIAPGTKLPVHEHPVINAGVLLKGRLRVVKRDGKVLNLKAGDAIVEVVDSWHHGVNPGDEPAEIIVFYAGVKGSPITVKEVK